MAILEVRLSVFLCVQSADVYTLELVNRFMDTYNNLSNTPPPGKDNDIWKVR